MLYHWFFEPSEVRIKLNKKYRMFLVNELKEFGGPCILSQKIEYSPATICNFLKGLGLSVGLLKKILNILHIPYDKAEPFVTEISWIKNPKLPFNLNTKEAAILSAAILGDGSNTTRVMYKNTNPELIKRVETSAKKLFGRIKVDHRISENNIKYILFPRIVGRVLIYMGVPYGNKMNQNQEVPKFIRNGDKRIQKSFLQQFFDDEGGVEVDYKAISLSQSTNCTECISTDFYNNMILKRTYYIRDLPKIFINRMKPPKILIGIKFLLKEIFNIFSTLRFKRIVKYKDHATAFWELKIQRKDDIKRFFNEINFSSKKKRENLDFMINRNYKMPWNIYNMIINESIEVAKNQGFIKPSIIAKNLGLPYRPINKRIKTLEKRGIFSKKNKKYILNIRM
jgi:hypothetical protein